MEPDIEYYFRIPIEILKGGPHDIKGENDIVIGTVTVDENNNASIIFNEKAESGGYLNEGSIGNIYFESTFDKEQIQNGGKKELDFSPLSEVPVDFKLNQVTPKVDLKVEGEQLTTPGDYKKIQWTITVTPTIENAWIYDDKTLSNFTILNPIGDNLTYVSDSQSMKLGTEDYTSYSFNDTELSWTFDSFNFEDFVDVDGKPVFTITFETEISSNAWNNSDGSDKAIFKNKASSTYEYYQYELDTDGYAQHKSDQVEGKSDSNEKTLDITTKLLNKDGRLLAGADEIEWTIYLNQESFSLSDATIKDTITVNGTTPINMVIKDMEIYEAIVTNDKLEKDGSGTPITPTITDNVFEHNLGAIDSPKIITYKTTVDASYKEDNNTKNFKNEVILNDGTMNLKKEKTVELGKHLIKKSGSPNYTDHTISWTINLNTESMELGASTVIDEIPAGLTFVPNSLSSNATFIEKGGVGTIDGINKETVYPNGAVVAQYDDLTSPQVITFKTTIDDPKYWAINSDEGRFTNKATLHTYDNISKYEVSEDSVFASEVLAKTATGYKHDTKTATWKITFNQNKMAMTNGVIVDEIPTNQEVVESTLKPNSAVKGYNYDKEANKLTITLNDISTESTITYDTKVVKFDDLESEGADKTFTIKNKATLTCDEMGGLSQSIEAEKVIGNSIVEKTGELPSRASKVIDWTVNINKNLIPITKPILVDNLAVGLILQESSVKLYNAKVNANGNISKGAQVTLTDEIVSYDENTNIFTFNFNKDIDTAYILEFSTYYEGAGDYSNAIGFKGGSMNLTSSEFSVNANNSSGGGTASPANRGTIVVSVVDDATAKNPISGATVQVGLQKKITDSDGKATFTNLVPDSYTITQISTLPQYTMPSKQTKTLGKGQTLDVELKNTTIKGTFKVTAKDIDNTPNTNVKDIEISVFKKNDDNTETLVKTLTTGATGTISFINLPYGSYIAKETKVPPQYGKPKETHLFDIEKSGETKTWNIEKSQKNRYCYSYYER